jgi:hypothetical protein
MKEEVRSFLGGVNKDSNALVQPKDTYRQAWNLVQISNEGNVYALVNEEGTVQTTTVFPDGFHVIGKFVLDTDLIVVLAHPSGYSQVGIVDATGLYERKVPNPNDGAPGDVNSELGLNIDNPVDLIARKRLAGDRIVYFCDGPNGRPMGSLNLDNPPPLGDISDNSKVIPDQNLTQIDLLEVQEVSGNLRNGMYRFVTRYYTADLTPTSLGIPSNGVPIVEDTRSEGRDKFDGEYPDFGAVNKSIALTVSNIDTSYPFMSLIVIRYENITNTLTVEEQPLINITGDNMVVNYSGDETEVTPLTQEELQEISISYNTAKCVTQKDNIAFWSNLTDSTNTFDAELQEVANDIKVEWVVKEVDYAPSDAITTLDVFELQSLPYVLENDATMIFEYIVLRFTRSINFPISSDVNNYTFHSRGDNASATIQITSPGDFHDGLVGDTILIDTVTFVAVQAAPALPEEFDVTSADTLTILANLNTAINNHPTLAGVVSSGTDGIDTITLVADVVGVGGNSIALTYTDITGVASVVTVGFAGGAASVAYTPDDVVLPAGTDTDLIYLLFNDAQFGGTGSGIPPGGTLDIAGVQDNTGQVFADTGVEVSSSSTGGAADAAIALGEFTDYKAEAMTFYFKGYRRQEVYSLGMLVNFTDGAPSFNYHIPGNDKSTVATTEAVRDAAFPDYHDETYGLTGTYVSATDNPTNQLYPGPDPGDDNLCYDSVLETDVIPANRKTRHHKMPTLQLEPHFRVDPTTGITKIRILGLKFTFNTPMSAGLRANIQSITFTRERRDTAQNRSIWAQGLVTRYVNLFRTFPYKWDYDPLEEASDGRWRKMPFYNNTFINNQTTDEAKGTAIINVAVGTAPSIAYEVADDPAVDDGTTGASNTRMAFFSPDTQLGVFNPNSAEGTKLVPQMRLNGTYISGGEIKPSHNSEDAFGSDLVASTTTTRLYKYMQIWTIVDYTNFEGLANGGSSDPALNPAIAEARYIPKGAEVRISDLIHKIDNSTSSRHLYIRTAAAPTFGVDFAAKQQVNFKAEMSAGFNWFFDDGSYSNDDNFSEGNVHNHLFSMIAENLNQYGSLSGSVYIPIATTRNLPAFAGAVPEPEIFEGDTFISKFAYRNVDVIPYKGLLSSVGGDIITKVNTGNGYSQEDATQHDDSPIRGMNFKAIGYFFVESGINCEYRHQYTDRSDPLAEIQEVPYFPKVDAYTALQQQAQEGDSKGYNLQYSFDNDSKTYSNKSAAQVTVGVFENRTIYSQSALEDEILDSYRIYAQNNFYDMPKHTGPIWDNFVYANTLYLHTPKSLWRAYVNDATMQATSIGEVVQGTGGLFSIPAKEVIVSTGGYAGSISQFAGVLTPVGYFFPDVLQGRIFMLGGEQLREVSNRGMQKYFENNMAEGLTNGSDYIDNPYTGVGITGAYDFNKRRYILVKRGTTNDFTWSFSSLTEKWISQHNYSPNLLFSQNNKLLSIENATGANATLHEHNVGDYGTYYGTTYASSLQMVFNEGAGIEKTYDNMLLHTKSLNGDTVVQFDTWDTLRVHTDTRNTATHTVVPTNAYGTKAVDGTLQEIRATRVKNKYAIAIPGDAVVDESLSIFDVGNLDSARPYKPRIKGDHATVDLVYNNTDNYKFIINFISCLFRPNAS